MKIILLLTFLANEAQAKMRFCRGRNCNNNYRVRIIKSEEECLRISTKILNSAYLRNPKMIFYAENPYEECEKIHIFLRRLIVEKNWSVYEPLFR